VSNLSFRTARPDSTGDQPRVIDATVRILTFCMSASPTLFNRAGPVPSPKPNYCSPVSNHSNDLMTCQTPN
jgi:hypothetical protein